MARHRLLLVLVISLVASCHERANGKTNGAVHEDSCPDSSEIFPCVCTVDSQGNLDMECSQVQDADELARVFGANFPSSAFRMLSIYGNNFLKVIRQGDLGTVSFQVILIESGVLEQVQDQAFSNSYSTATRIVIQDNSLSSFPFSELPLFTSLQELWLDRNLIAHFPMLESPTITDVSLNQNPFNQIPLDAFRTLPNIRTIDIGIVELEEIIPGTFSNLQELSWLYLLGNNLTHIPGGAIELSGARAGHVILQYNKISTIEVGGITGLQDGSLNLEHNSISFLEEEVYGPLVEEGATIFLRGNPLNCGCEIAWLFSNNATFLEYISPETACYTGQLLSSLDPAMFEKLC